MNFHHYLWLLSAFQHRLLEVLVVNVVQFWEGCPAEIMFPRGGWRLFLLFIKSVFIVFVHILQCFVGMLLWFIHLYCVVLWEIFFLL